MAKYIWPVPAWTGINQLFGTYPGGFNPPGGHTGTDYGTPIGTPIRAIADGVVKHADWFRGSYYDNPWLIEPSFAGIVVVIDHGECLSVYAHMNDTPLNVGQRVRQGDVIGGSGNTRNGVDVFGPHLHFEIMPDGWDNTNGTYGRVNPALYCTEYWGVADETIIRPESSGTITPIEGEEQFMNISYDDQVEMRDNLRKLVGMAKTVQDSVAPINTSAGPKSLRQFVADGTRAAQAAAAQTADINTAQGPKSVRQFIADGTRAAQGSAPLVVDIAKAVVVAPDVDAEAAK